MSVLEGIAYVLGYLTGILGLAQVTAWGLSLFHVGSGVWGPFLLILVASAVAGSAGLVARGGRR